jgi:hypothetical protein
MGKHWYQWRLYDERTGELHAEGHVWADDMNDPLILAEAFEAADGAFADLELVVRETEVDYGQASTPIPA